MPNKKLQWHSLCSRVSQDDVKVSEIQDSSMQESKTFCQACRWHVLPATHLRCKRQLAEAKQSSVGAADTNNGDSAPAASAPQVCCRQDMPSPSLAESFAFLHAAILYFRDLDIVSRYPTAEGMPL